MSLSSVCVVTKCTSSQLVPYEGRHKRSKNKNKKEQEEMTMEKTMKIEGMMCGHCEASVKKALEALAEVEAAEVSHEKGTAVVTLRSAVSDEVLKKAVEEKDYTVVEIR